MLPLNFGASAWLISQPPSQVALCCRAALPHCTPRVWPLPSSRMKSSHSLWWKALCQGESGLASAPARAVFWPVRARTTLRQLRLAAKFVVPWHFSNSPRAVLPSNYSCLVESSCFSCLVFCFPQCRTWLVTWSKKIHDWLIDSTFIGPSPHFNNW